MKKLLVPLALLLIAMPASPQAGAAPWVDAMKKVHEKFTGEKGTFAHFGDSITITMAFWSSLKGSRKNMTPEAEEAFKLVDGYMKPDCWNRWKGPEFGNNGSMTIRWAQENSEKWLCLQPWQKHWAITASP